MDMQNIGASNRDDAFYRYKMPKMVTKIEGRGNGIKTNVVNMVDIAKALARPASYTTKYFGNELGAQSKFDEKTGTSLVNGAHDTAKLAGLLENFIKKYVQCYSCGNPETEIIITKSQMINLKCAACGFVSDVDMRDKLTTFILKSPPVQKKSSKDKKAMRRAEKERLKEGEAADEEQKKMKKAAGKKKSTSTKDAVKNTSTKKKSNGSDEDHSPSLNQDENDREPTEEEEDDDDDNGDDIQWQTDTSIEAAQQRIQSQLNVVTADMVMLTTNEEKLKPKPKPVKPSPKHEAKVQENGGKSGNNKEMLVNEIKEHLKEVSSASHLKAFLGSLTGTSQEIMDALFIALFEGIGKGLANEVIKKKGYLAVATQEGGSQLALLHAVEAFLERANPEAVKELALALKALYDNDVLEEEFILEWYQNGVSGSNKDLPVWKCVKPFIEWLQNAESESESEEE